MSIGEQNDEAVGQLLVALQDEDIHADQLVYRLAHLPSRLALDEITTRRAELRRDRAIIDRDRSELVARAAQLESDVAESDERLAGLERRLGSGQAGSYRDEAAIAEEIAGVGRRKHELEDEQLELMEVLEPFEAALMTIELEEMSLEEQRSVRTVELASDEAKIAEERAEVDERRKVAAARVPGPRLAEYEKLRAHLGGVAVSRLVHGTCSGCNLSLSSTELDRVRHLPEGSVAHCEQCGRILVP